LKKNPGIAALLSFFIPGAGQIYNEQIIKGLVIFGLCGMWLYSSFVNGYRPFLCLLAAWIIGIFDALYTARYINNPEKEEALK